ncbi:MAG TPA: metallophosphoesterase [Calditrichaeota bacterium]|nr:metallophosphoesterase [Calditrichota bacterium]
MIIGIISDTHGRVPAEVHKYFKQVDQIIHAGDIGNPQVITELKTLAPVIAVYGNVDGFPLVSDLKRIRFFSLENKRFCLTHIVSTPKVFSYELFRMNREVDIVIFGHTHIAEKKEYNSILFVNPGSASHSKPGKQKSVALMELTQQRCDIRFIYF